MRKVYFDNAATTRIADSVISEMTKTMSTCYGNPSSTHNFGRSAKDLIETSRKNIAKQLNVSSSEIIFTAGGSEADNLILNTAVCSLKVTKIITTATEHHAVLNTIEKLYSTFNIEVVVLDVNAFGDPDYAQLEKVLSNSVEEKVLVSLMFANNEIGTLLDVEKVCQLCKKYDAYFHSDAVQCVGHYNLDLQKTPIDFIAVSAHKFHGPKGVGFAYFRKGTKISPMLCGGSQEKGARAGTENVHGIVGMNKALELAYEDIEKSTKTIFDLKTYFINQLESTFAHVQYNGYTSFEKSSYCILNVRFPFKSNLLLFNLDLKGIACSGGSACQSGSNSGSHVLNAILSPSDKEKASIRFSFSVYNTKDEVDYVISNLKEIVDSKELSKTV